jgi:predicted amidohydrolase YtcJ
MPPVSRVHTVPTIVAIGLAGALLQGCSGGIGGEPNAPDVIYFNGNIITVNEEFGLAQAVAVKDGRFTAVGSNDEVTPLASRGTRLVDLGGATVTPGFEDCHAHLYRGDDQFASWPANIHDLRSFGTVEGLLDTLRVIAANTPEGEWIHGRLSETGFPDDRLPQRWTLDEAVPNHPLALPRGPHTWTVNSMALELAGVTGDTPNPEGGVIERNAAGEPTGHLREGSAHRFVERLLPAEARPTEEQIQEDLYSQMRLLVSLGVTGANVAGIRPGANFSNLESVYVQHGEELPRLTVQVRISPGYDSYEDPVEGVQASIRELEQLSFNPRVSRDRLKLGGVKMSVDGGFSGRAARLLVPYPDGTVGAVRIPEFALYEVGRWAHERGWQLGVHMIGDGGVQLGVDVIDRIVREGTERDHRHFVHHVSVTPPVETMAKMARSNISVCSQPNFTYDLAPFYRQALSGDRLATNNPQRSLMSRDVRVAYGSDHRPYGPLVAIWAAVWREGRDGLDYARATEAVTLEEAIRAHTLGTAYLGFHEKDRGSIEPGKLADMVVLTHNILTHDPALIHHIGVQKTIIGGEIVYEAAGQPRTARFDDGEYWYVGGARSGGPVR